MRNGASESPGRQRQSKLLAHIMGFTYYGFVNITLSIDEEVVKRVRKIAIERDTTLTGLVRAYLEERAVERARAGRNRRNRAPVRPGSGRSPSRVRHRTRNRQR